MTDSPTPVWTPTDAQVADAQLTRFAADLGLGADYLDLLDWSLADIDRYWSAVADWFAVRWRTAPGCTLASREMPGARWFPGGELSYAEHVFADRDPDATALLAVSETRGLDTVDEWSWARLRAETARLRARLQALGIGRGDRVVAYLPNIPETIAAFLATSSLGAIWSCAAPEFGVDSVVARFRQIEPALFLSVDGYVYRGKRIDRHDEAAAIAERIGARHVQLGYLSGTGWGPELAGEEAGEDTGDGGDRLEFDAVPFDHPLWVLFSSGTTGLPKAIMHSQGGIVLTHLAMMGLQFDVRRDDRFFWFSTTGWMMWNVVVAALLVGSAAVLHDGEPAPETLWDLAARTRMTQFGASAGFLDQCRRLELDPTDGRDLSALRVIGSTGSPLSPDCFDWVYAHLPTTVALMSTSGGTDVCATFLGSAPTYPIYRGELGPACLGTDLHAYSPDGRSVIGEVGELVVTQPTPSMPVGFWNDPDGERYRAAYFDAFPGVWTHGDWIEITPRRTAVISGRSDATINRGGVRFGSSEIYHALNTVPEIEDALVIDLPREGTHGVINLFVKPAPGVTLDDELITRVKAAIRTSCSPRHVPDVITAVGDIPRTSSGKKLEVPIKRILTGSDPAKVVSRSSLANPDSLDEYIAFAARD